jgi:hypothetical protein
MTIKAILGAVALLVLASAPSQAKTILFVGNSFTFGEYSTAKHYQAETVTDLNGPGADGRTLGGVPAIFKAFTREAGLDYDVSLETAPGKGLDFHYAQKLPLLSRAWDDVVLQSFSTLDAAHPGDPAILVRYTRLLAEALAARNPQVKIYLSSTWSRPDLTYPPGRPWSGKPIQQMALDVAAGYEAARKAAPNIAGVAPIGLAFNRAIAINLADPNPYDGVGAGQIDLWAYDNYHASAFGYYLEALVLFGQITGRDPLSLTEHETVGEDLGLSPAQAHALQQVAHDQLTAGQ